MNLESIIREYIPIVEHEKTPAGWYPVLCKVCNDHGKKGKRGGFRFEPDGSVYYHCFNCGPSANAVYVPGEKVSQKLKNILYSFGIPREEIKKFEFQQLGKHFYLSKQKNSKKIDEEISLPPTTSLLKSFVPIKEGSKKLHKNHYRYLKERNIDPEAYDFYLCKDSTDKLWFNRIILPIKCYGKIRGYIGRSIIPNEKRKYLISKGLTASKIVFNFDQLFDNTDRPLIVCEGPFDAILIKGVSILGNQISKFQKYWIGQTRRKIIYVPDQYGNGFVGAEQALSFGWAVGLPEIGSCKDINEGIIKYGKLYVLKTIYENTYYGEQGLIKARVYCK